ncbi:hypothetical protein, partial [Lysobacter soli]|uniref:hypothetical protein n=1 Tax=Lysobacter soli TaxID=453783 RepID=UPI00240EAFA8
GGEKALLANHWFARLRTPERYAFGPGRGNEASAVNGRCRTGLRCGFWTERKSRNGFQLSLK